jgi:hypothetical protein
MRTCQECGSTKNEFLKGFLICIKCVERHNEKRDLCPELTLIIHYLNQADIEEIISHTEHEIKHPVRTGNFQINEDVLTLEKLTLIEIKEVMLKIREIEQRNPKRMIFCEIKGVENKTLAEATAMMKKIFPTKEKWFQEKKKWVISYYHPTILCPLCEFIRGTEKEVVDHIVSFHSEKEIKDMLGWE